MRASKIQRVVRGQSRFRFSAQETMQDCGMKSVELHSVKCVL